MSQITNTLPDVTLHTAPQNAQSLEWVGMEHIGLPVSIVLSDDTVVATSAKVNIYTSLDTAAKGIHMSRLYLKLNELLANQEVTIARLSELLDAVLLSHKEISQSAKIKVSFDLTLSKKALVTENSGYQSYEVAIEREHKNGISANWLELTIPYSSTCPCSTSLAEQLNISAIAQQFQEDSISKTELLDWLSSAQTALATPHNQRSYAYLKLHLSNDKTVYFDQLISDVEQAIGTPVQTAVKREDEQEFAKLNGSNLMFCEDAARRVKRYLESLAFVQDYWFKVEHQESLHAHNAVVIDTKR